MAFAGATLGDQHYYFCAHLANAANLYAIGVDAPGSRLVVSSLPSDLHGVRFDRSTKKLYGYTTGTSQQFVSIDPESGTVVPITTIASGSSFVEANASALGNHHYYFYVHTPAETTSFDQLYSIDLGASPVSVTPIGRHLSGTLREMQFDDESAALYGVTGDTIHKFVRIDPATGVFTTLASVASGTSSVEPDASTVGNRHYYFYVKTTTGQTTSSDQMYSIDLSSEAVSPTPVGSQLSNVAHGLQFVQVAATATTTALRADANVQQFGLSTAFTAYVASADSGISTVPTGTVTFSDGSTSLSGVALDDTGHAAYSTSSLAVGAHTIQAAYAGDSSFGASSASVNVSIQPAAPSFQINCTPNPVSYQQQLTCSATVSGDHGGTIALTINGAPWASGAPDNTGTFAATRTVQVSSGNYTVAASYSGDTNYAATTASMVVTAQLPKPNLQVNCTPNPVSFQQQLTCSATVSGDHGGTIALTINGAPWASGVPDNTGTFSAARTVQVSSGNYTVMASYSGDSNYAATTASMVVTAQLPKPNLQINCTPNPVSFQQQLTCSTTVSGDHGGTIALTINGAPWASGAPDNTGTFAATRTVQVSSGNYTVAASYSGDTNYAATTASMVVTAQLPKPNLQINCTPNPVSIQQQLTCSATVSGDHGGTIALAINGTPWASGAPDNTGTFSAVRTVQVSSGNYTVTASYSGDTNYAATTATMVVTAQLPKPNLQINCTPNPVSIQQQLTCSATVSGDHGGTIALAINGTPWASGAPDNTGTFSAARTVQVSSGNYTVAASYSGDTNYAATTASMVVTAQLPKPNLQINCTPNPVSIQQQLTCSATVSGDHGGTIALTINGAAWASGAPDNTGTFAATRTVQVSSGNYTVAASYSGDTNYAATTTSMMVTAQP